MATNNGIKKIVVNLDTLQSKSPKKQTKKRSMIEPNKLKDAFMKQVQHYKSVANSQKSLIQVPLNTNAYTNDFNDSVAYLNSIKKSTDKVHTELPAELMGESVSSFNAPMLVDNKQSISIIPSQCQTSSPSMQYKVDTAVPYGCLKNGIKPSFKNWTRSNRQIQTQIQQIPIQQTQIQQTPIQQTPIQQTQMQQMQQIPIQQTQMQQMPIQQMPIQQMPIQQMPIQQMPIQQMPTPIQQMPTPRPKPIQQQTIIKRHIVGKTKNTRQVGVLIKNINTRKMIIGAHKDLKKININEVKTHLKNNGLLKVGTTAPVDVLRQTYESSILAGNITNKNEDTLYHNFMNDKEIV